MALIISGVRTVAKCAATKCILGSLQKLKKTKKYVRVRSWLKGEENQKVSLITSVVKCHWKVPHSFK